MSLDQIVNILAAIVALASTYVIATSPQTAAIITAFGNAFSGSLRAATGR